MRNPIARVFKSALLGATGLALAAVGAARANDVVTPTTTIERTQSPALDSAARLIEQDTQGRVLEIRQSDTRAGDFVAAVAEHRGVSVVRLDTANAVTSVPAADAPSWADRDLNKSRAQDARHARFDISEAIAQAAQDTNRPAVEARLLRRGDVMAYDVRTHDGSDLVYDADTGLRLANPETFISGAS